MSASANTSSSSSSTCCNNTDDGSDNGGLLPPPHLLSQQHHLIHPHHHQHDPLSLHGVNLPQTPEDPTILHSHLTSAAGGSGGLCPLGPSAAQPSAASSSVSTSTPSPTHQSVLQPQSPVDGSANGGEIQSQEASSTESGEGGKSGNKRNNHGKLLHTNFNSNYVRFVFFLN